MYSVLDNKNINRSHHYDKLISGIGHLSEDMAVCNRLQTGTIEPRRSQKDKQKERKKWSCTMYSEYSGVKLP